MTLQGGLKRIGIPKRAGRLKAQPLRPLAPEKDNPVRKEFEIGQLGNEELKERSPDDHKEFRIFITFQYLCTACCVNLRMRIL